MEAKNNEKVVICCILPFMYEEINLFLKNINEKAKQLDVDLICMVEQNLNDNSKYVTKQFKSICELINNQYIKGLIICNSVINSQFLNSIVSKYNLNSIPIVSISPQLVKNCSNIVLDDENGIKSIMEHLIIDHKYAKIGFVCGSKNDYLTLKRLEAYKTSLKLFDIPYKSELVSSYSETSINGGKIGAKELFVKRKLEPVSDIQAIIAPDDSIALGAAQELRNLGINCPEEIAIVGFGNKLDSKICEPSLTTLEMDFNLQIIKSIELLVDIIRNNTKPQNLVTPGRLIIRNSCGCEEMNLSELEIESNSNKVQITDSQIIEAVKSIQKKIIPFYNIIDSSWVENLVLNFMYDIENQSSDRFISTLNIYLEIIFGHNEDISNFQNIITLLRNEISPLIKDPNALLKASDIWNKARVTINHLSNLAVSNKFNKYDSSLLNVYLIEQSLAFTFTLKEFLAVMETSLKRNSINSCYISLYEKQDDILKKAKIIFAYANNKRLPIARNYYFDPKEIIPNNIKNKYTRHTYIINPLYYKDINLGFVVYEADNICKYTLDILSNQISSTLYKIKMFKRFKKSENIKETQNCETQLELKPTIPESSSNISSLEFLADVSHEIRTSLNCIIGFSDILSDMESPSSQYTKYISLVMQESDKLLNLVNELLDISKLSSGKLSLNNELFDIKHCLNSINLTYFALAENKNLYYNVYGLEIIPQFVIGDSLRLKQVLSNIIGNAIKFSEKGGITISIEIVKETENKIEILFNINDTGIGIPNDRQNTIFERYTQAENNTYTKYGGTGLGMPIAKQLVELMGGTIGVDSVVNEGSTFWFTAVFETVNQNYIYDDKNTKAENNLNIFINEIQNSTIMVIEDYFVNMELIRLYLNKVGCKLIEAHNGEEALKLFKTNSIDLIITDAEMNPLNGYEITKSIRRLKKGKNIPILGMTANSFEKDLKRCIEVGMNDVIIKPFQRYDFIYKVGLCLSGAKGDNNKTIPAIETSNNLNQEQLIDIDRNLRELDGDTKFFKSIMTEFLKKAESQVDIIRKKSKAKDFESLSLEAHSIKGAAMSLSAKPLAKIAEIIENKGKSKDLKDIDKLINLLEKIIINTKEYLKTKMD